MTQDDNDDESCNTADKVMKMMAVMMVWVTS